MKTAEEIVQEIQKLLWWDFDNECWKNPEHDPRWNGLDELCYIDELLSDNGFSAKI